MRRSRILKMSAMLTAVAAVASSPSALRAQRAPGRPAAAPVPAPAAALDTAAILAGARSEIDAANAAWVPGLRDRDAASIAAAYSDSGMFIAPDGSVTRGRDAIARMYAARFPSLTRILDGGVDQEGMAVESRTRIYEWGRAWLTMEARTPGNPPVRSGGAYLTVWRRESDGHWRIEWNLALPPDVPSKPVGTGSSR